MLAVVLPLPAGVAHEECGGDVLVAFGGVDVIGVGRPGRARTRFDTDGGRDGADERDAGEYDEVLAHSRAMARRELAFAVADADPIELGCDVAVFEACDERRVDGGAVDDLDLRVCVAGRRQDRAERDTERRRQREERLEGRVPPTRLELGERGLPDAGRSRQLREGYRPRLAERAKASTDRRCEGRLSRGWRHEYRSVYGTGPIVHDYRPDAGRGVSARRLAEIPGFGIDRVAAAAGEDPRILRLENLDTDLAPPAGALEATRRAIGVDETNSWLPFTGRDDLKRAVVDHVARRGGPHYDPEHEVVITSGEGDAMLDALLSLTDPGDEVVLTDPTYAGMLNRVRLAGATPRLAPLTVADGEWRLDLDALEHAAGERTRVVFVNSASFPSGWVPTREEWQAIADLCRDRDLWLVYWAGFEGVLFDARTPLQPAALPGMRERTVTIGAASFEQRMIAWRIGWIVAPRAQIADLSRVHIYNGLVAGGHNQVGVRAALEDGDGGLAEANAEWQRRRDETLRQLDGLPAIRPAGGWSLLLDVAALGYDCVEASERLLEELVAATPMRGWGGPVADRHLRFVFSNEPVERLALLGRRLGAALPSRTT